MTIIELVFMLCVNQNLGSLPSGVKKMTSIHNKEGEEQKENPFFFFVVNLKSFLTIYSSPVLFLLINLLALVRKI